MIHKLKFQIINILNNLMATNNNFKKANVV